MFPHYLTAMALLCAMSAAQAQSAAQPPAQTAVPAPALTPAQTDAQATLEMETMTAEQKARLAPRRPAKQVVGAALPTVTDGYRPTLTPPTAAGVPNVVGTLPVRPTPARAGAAPNAPLPVPLINCAAAGCSGADGVRYNTGTAGVTVDPAGRTCRQVGNTVQCN